MRTKVELNLSIDYVMKRQWWLQFDGIDDVIMQSVNAAFIVAIFIKFNHFALHRLNFLVHKKVFPLSKTYQAIFYLFLFVETR